MRSHLRAGCQPLKLVTLVRPQPPQSKGNNMKIETYIESSDNYHEARCLEVRIWRLVLRLGWITKFDYK